MWKNASVWLDCTVQYRETQLVIHFSNLSFLFLVEHKQRYLEISAEFKLILTPSELDWTATLAEGREKDLTYHLATLIWELLVKESSIA